MKTETLIRSGAGVALWRQVADVLRREIEDGIATGELPAAAALAERFGVNRHTVGAALSALAGEGLVDIARGRSARVRKPMRVRYPISMRTRFGPSVEAAGMTARQKLLRARETAAPSDAREALGLKAGSPVVEIETIGFADDEPLAYSHVFFDPVRFPEIGRQVETAGSISGALARFGVDDYIRARTQLGARPASEAERAALRLTPGGVVVVTRALDVDAETAQPVLWASTCFAADRVAFEFVGGEEA